MDPGGSAAHPQGGGGGGGGLAACERKIAAWKERQASVSAAYRASLLSVRSQAQKKHSLGEELRGLTALLRNLQDDLAETISIKARKESKRQVTEEAISSSAATNEKLKNSVVGLRSKRDQRAAVIADELKAVEALEEKCNEDKKWRKDIEEALRWYAKFLGFKLEVVEGEGMKFIFNKVDLQNPEKEYSFTLKPDKDRYTLLQCDPIVKDFEELMKDLNLTNDLHKFVTIVRQRFQAEAAATVNVSSPVAMPVDKTPVAMPVDTRNRNVADQSHSWSKNKSHGLPSKRKAAALSAASPATAVSSVRRSPRFLR